MQKKFVLFLMMAALPLAALFACSDNGNATPSAPVVVAPDSRPPTTDGSQPTSDAPVATSDAGAECGTPAKLFDFGDGGLFCPFSSTAGGKNLYCASGTQQCCVTPQAANTPSTCETRGPDAGCPVANSTRLECGHPEDCAAGEKCCAVGGTNPVTYNEDVSCGPYLSKFSGTRCQANCAAGELVVCGHAQDCPAGQTCVAVKPKGNNTGVCH